VDYLQIESFYVYKLISKICKMWCYTKNQTNET